VVNATGQEVKALAAETGRFSKPGLRRVGIAGLATYVPPRVLTNADLEKIVDTTDEWIQQRTGIRPTVGRASVVAGTLGGLQLEWNKAVA